MSVSFDVHIILLSVRADAAPSQVHKTRWSGQQETEEASEPGEPGERYKAVIMKGPWLVPGWCLAGAALRWRGYGFGPGSAR